MIDSKRVKEILSALGADLCGIASMDRLANASKGYHPLDVFPACKSAISFGCRFPVGALNSKSDVPYTMVRNAITRKLDAMALDFCIELERHQVTCVPVPTIESQWDECTGRYRSIVSQKHIAQAAGLGTIGRHSLLITPEYGSMVWLGAVLCGQELEPDEMKEPICNGCNLCVDVCPVNALDGAEVEQQACWNYAFGEDRERQIWRISCHRCRDICPYNLGSQNSFMKK